MRYRPHLHLLQLLLCVYLRGMQVVQGWPIALLVFLIHLPLGVSQIQVQNAIFSERRLYSLSITVILSFHWNVIFTIFLIFNFSVFHGFRRRSKLSEAELEDQRALEQARINKDITFESRSIVLYCMVLTWKWTVADCGHTSNLLLLRLNYVHSHFLWYLINL